ncbi:MFS transporter [soil metagenome]
MGRTAGEKSGKVGLRAHRLRTLLAVAGILLVAANLRAPITSVGPLLGSIRESFGFSSGVAGLLTAVPLLAFAAISPIAPGIARGISIERALFGALVLLGVGISLRSTYLPAALFGGTLILGIAIALGNVLLPSLIKRDFPANVGLITGMYTATMSTFAALASGVSVPLAAGLGVGWRGSLLFWTLPVFAGILLWLPRLRTRARGARPPRRSNADSSIWRSALAWQVTLFMGLQASIFYVSITWLPSILREEGLATAQAGWMVSIMQFVAIPAALIAPVIAERLTSQRLVLVCAAASSAAGITGLLLFAGATVLPWIILLGVGQGACISLALTLFSLRAPDSGRAAELSSMAQSVGYLLAALGPAAFGILRDLSGSWSAPLASLLGIAFALAFVSLGAGRDKLVPVSGTAPSS